MCMPKAPKAPPSTTASQKPLRVLLSRQSLDDLLIDPSNYSSTAGSATPPNSGGAGAGRYMLPGVMPDVTSAGGPMDSGLRIVR